MSGMSTYEWPEGIIAQDLQEKIMEKNLKFFKSRKKAQKNKNAKNMLLKKENSAWLFLFLIVCFLGRFLFKSKPLPLK